MCRCQSENDYCEDWEDEIMSANRSPWVGVFWIGMIFLLFLFWGMVLSSCASWKTMSSQQKHDAVLEYYSAFSSGLKMTCALAPTDKQALCSSAIGLADVAIGKLGQAYQDKIDTKNAEIETAAKIEWANAVVGAM